MFTLPELIQYFQGQYTEEQLIEALKKFDAPPNEMGQYPIQITQRPEAAFILSQEAAKQLPGSLFEQGFNDASAWLPPHSGNGWSKKYMAGWTAGAAEQMQEYPPYCGIRDNE